MGDPDYLASTATLECGGGMKGDREVRDGREGKREGKIEGGGGRKREERRKGTNTVTC